MDLSEIEVEKFAAFVISELKTYGIKCQKEKKKKYTQKKCTIRNIFCTHLHLLDLSDVLLANGKAVKVPKFLTVACSRVLEQVETEGLFRKAGSIIRQREIRAGLEAGEQLNKTHHVIDVANVIKYFFRELPLPLITPCIQDALIQCLLLGENSIDAMLLACLLLPPLAINTLCFFMQFLHTVSLSENRNKMTVQNLAIIFTPSLMPYPHVKSQRFQNNVKIVKILIENANSIGIIPLHIEFKLRESSNKLTPEGYLDDIKQKSQTKTTENNGQIPESTKKKRRSDIFHGLRRIVGSSMGSTELLDNSFEGNNTKLIVPKSKRKINKTNQLVVNEISENKKRKNLDSDSVFKSRKKETKKTRLSLGGERMLKNISFNAVTTSTDRRWSIVGSSCSKNKNYKNKKTFETNNSDSENIAIKADYDGGASQFIINNSNRYEEITGKEETIESQASKEIPSIQTPQPLNDDISFKTERSAHIHSQNEVIAVESESSSPSTEQLVQCLNRKLHVRRSINHCKIRSGKERNTDSNRRRSQNNISIQLLKASPKHEKPLPAILDSQNTQTPLSGDLNNSFGETVSVISTAQSRNSVTGNGHLNELWLSGEEFFRKTEDNDSNCQVNNMQFDNFVTPVRIKNISNTDKTPMLPPISLPRKTTNIVNHLGNVKNSTTSTKFNREALSTPDIIEEINGRASIARLREENAGMVMAKAKLFDSLETKAHHNLLSKAAEQYSARIHSSGSNTPVSTSKHRERIVVFKSSSRQLTPKSTVTNGKLIKPCTVNYENARILSAKPESIKTFKNCQNIMSPLRSKK